MVRGDPRYQQGHLRAEDLSQLWSEDAVNMEGDSERCRRDADDGGWGYESGAGRGASGSWRRFSLEPPEGLTLPTPEFSPMRPLRLPTSRTDSKSMCVVTDRQPQETLQVVTCVRPAVLRVRRAQHQGPCTQGRQTTRPRAQPALVSPALPDLSGEWAH